MFPITSLSAALMMWQPLAILCWKFYFANRLKAARYAICISLPLLCLPLLGSLLVIMVCMMSITRVGGQICELLTPDMAFWAESLLVTPHQELFLPQLPPRADGADHNDGNTIYSSLEPRGDCTFRLVSTAYIDIFQWLYGFCIL